MTDDWRTLGKAMRDALQGARETILDLKNARGSEAEGPDEEWVADIDAAIAAFDKALAAPPAKPDGWLVDEGFMLSDPQDKYAVPLYAHPPQCDTDRIKELEQRNADLNDSLALTDDRVEKLETALREARRWAAGIYGREKLFAIIDVALSGESAAKEPAPPKEGV